MAKSRTLEASLARLKEIEAEPPSAAITPEVKKALASRINILAARAVSVAAARGLRDLLPDIAAVFTRFMENPVKSDPGCRAKIAAIEALNKLGSDEREPFLIGIRHVQMEPAFGPPVDTADKLRGECACGLYRLGYPDLHFELLTLLMDREPLARRMAIRVLTEAGTESAELLLRAKALQGDREPDVLADCFSALITVAPERSIPFVARFLSSESQLTAEDAALALGNSRRASAFELLRNRRARSIDPQSRRMLLLPIALTRCEEACGLLCRVIADETRENAIAAVKALKVCADSETRQRQVREAVQTRNDSAITAALAETE